MLAFCWGSRFHTTEALKFDVLTMTFCKVKVPRNRHWKICGEQPTITELIFHSHSKTPARPSEEDKRLVFDANKSFRFDQEKNIYEEKICMKFDKRYGGCELPHNCTFCGLCQAVCPQKIISVDKIAHSVTFPARRRCRFIKPPLTIKILLKIWKKFLHFASRVLFTAESAILKLSVTVNLSSKTFPELLLSDRN